MSEAISVEEGKRAKQFYLRANQRSRLPRRANLQFSPPARTATIRAGAVEDQSWSRWRRRRACTARSTTSWATAILLRSSSPLFATAARTTSWASCFSFRLVCRPSCRWEEPGQAREIKPTGACLLRAAGQTPSLVCRPFESCLTPAGPAADVPRTHHYLIAPFVLSPASTPPCLLRRRGPTAGLHARACVRKDGRGFAFSSPCRSSTVLSWTVACTSSRHVLPWAGARAFAEQVKQRSSLWPPEEPQPRRARACTLEHNHATALLSVLPLCSLLCTRHLSSPPVVGHPKSTQTPALYHATRRPLTDVSSHI
jgi:hypothetical protein